MLNEAGQPTTAREQNAGHKQSRDDWPIFQFTTRWSEPTDRRVRKPERKFGPWTDIPLVDPQLGAIITGARETETASDKEMENDRILGNQTEKCGRIVSNACGCRIFGSASRIMDN